MAITLDEIKKLSPKAKVLIIDEVSMLHAHQLDIVNSICKRFKEPFLPFGGLQVILCGDFFQLPPVTRYGSRARFVIESRANRILQNIDLHKAERC